ncbi:MAG: hypothetical protein ACE5EW_01520, partial [Thermoplasmata archaeon]
MARINLRKDRSKDEVQTPQGDGSLAEQIEGITALQHELVALEEGVVEKVSDVNTKAQALGRLASAIEVRGSEVIQRSESLDGRESAVTEREKLAEEEEARLRADRQGFEDESHAIRAGLEERETTLKSSEDA